MPWKIKTITEDNMIPSKTIFAPLGVRKITEDKNIKIKLAKINQKDPTSNIVPKKDTSEFPEKIVDNKKAKAIPNPDNKSQDFGKIIRPSKNRAIAQKITHAVSPTTKSSPLDVSIGILEKGKKKSGNNTTTKNKDKNESLSNIFVRIDELYYILINKDN